MSNRTATIKAVVLGDATEFKDAMNDVEVAAAGAGDKVKRDLGESFDSLGEASGGAEQKFIGLSDTIGGTADVMEGLRTGNVQQLAMGFADLAGATEALWSSVGKTITTWWAKVTATTADTAATATNTTATIGQRIATVASTIATKAWAAAQWILNAALSANPIALVIIGITALVAAIVLAWKHSETFRAIVTGAFNAVWGAIKWVWDWLSENFPKLLDILIWPFQKWFEINKAIIDGVMSGIGTAKDWIVYRFNEVVGFVTGLPGRISSAAGGMWDGIKDSFRGALNWLIGKWNGLSFGLPKIDLGPFGSFGPYTFTVPQIAYFAEGGLVKGGRGGVFGMVGEGRNDELVVPLDRAGKAAGLGNTVNLTVQVLPGANARQIGRELQGYLNEYLRAAP